ncbi:MAG: hypothetical protein HQK66_11545 [Desulfamplus sp.]|nr:hypothetical protein [Desulfamplus sp.]
MISARDSSMEEIRESLDQIKLQVNRCSEITHAILKFGRKNETRIQPLCPGDIIPEIIRMIEKKAAVNGIGIECEISPEISRFMGDPSQFQQVILNLVNNAMDAVAERHGTSGGVVTIRAFDTFSVNGHGRDSAAPDHGNNISISTENSHGRSPTAPDYRNNVSISTENSHGRSPTAPDYRNNVSISTGNLHGQGSTTPDHGNNVSISTVKEKDGKTTGKLNPGDAPSGKPREIEISVTDNGSGIHPDHLDKIFSPFFTTKPVGKGTGLGLSVCYGIIKGFDGTMEVSSSKNIGTSFTVRLPAID